MQRVGLACPVRSEGQSTTGMARQSSLPAGTGLRRAVEGRGGHGYRQKPMVQEDRAGGGGRDTQESQAGPSTGTAICAQGRLGWQEGPAARPVRCSAEGWGSLLEGTRAVGVAVVATVRVRGRTSGSKNRVSYNETSKLTEGLKGNFTREPGRQVLPGPPRSPEPVPRCLSLCPRCRQGLLLPLS